jgi:hypothetical protein
MLMKMLMEKETGQDSNVLSRSFSVELPGIEPAALPVLLAPELLVRYVSFPFSPARYMRLRFES